MKPENIKNIITGAAGALDTRKVNNTCQLVATDEDFGMIENLSFQNLKSLSEKFGVMYYKTQITIHGIWNPSKVREIEKGMKFKGLISNQNGSLGITWSCVDGLTKSNICNMAYMLGYAPESWNGMILYSFISNKRNIATRKKYSYFSYDSHGLSFSMPFFFDKEKEEILNEAMAKAKEVCKKLNDSIVGEFSMDYMVNRANGCNYIGVTFSVMLIKDRDLLCDIISEGEYSRYSMLEDKIKSLKEEHDSIHKKTSETYSKRLEVLTNLIIKAKMEIKPLIVELAPKETSFIKELYGKDFFKTYITSVSIERIDNIKGKFMYCEKGSIRYESLINDIASKIEVPFEDSGNFSLDYEKKALLRYQKMLEDDSWVEELKTNFLDTISKIMSEPIVWEKKKSHGRLSQLSTLEGRALFVIGTRYA